MQKIHIFPNLDDEVPTLVTNIHGSKELAAYQVLVDAGVFASVIVNELPVELARKLYPKIYPHINLEVHAQTGGTLIKPSD